MEKLWNRKCAFSIPKTLPSHISLSPVINFSLMTSTHACCESRPKSYIKPPSSDTGALKECIFRQLESLDFRDGIHFTLYVLILQWRIRTLKSLGLKTGSQRRSQKTPKWETELEGQGETTGKGEKKASIGHKVFKGKNREDIQTRVLRSSNQHRSQQSFL